MCGQVVVTNGLGEILHAGVLVATHVQRLKPDQADRVSKTRLPVQSRARDATVGLSVTRLADGSGFVNFAGVPSSAGRRFAGPSVEVAIAAGSARLSARDARCVSAHDRSRQSPAWLIPPALPGPVRPWEPILAPAVVPTYAYAMESAMTLLRRVRSDAGLSVRALAHRADVSASTVARIESGQVDPTYGMLIQILSACGQDIRITTRRRSAPAMTPPPQPPRIASLATAWKPTALGQTPDWARFRGTLDYLTRHPNVIPGAIRKRPPASGSAMIDTLLAGIAEKLADDSGCPRPAWTQKAPALGQEWAMPGTPQMRRSRREATPPQLLRRGLVLDRASLWRNQAPSDG